MMNPALSFNEVAQLYHEVRPRYPQKLFDELINLTDLPENSRVLEIGAGTGIATIELVKRGFRVVAVEPGTKMASILKKNLKDYKAEIAVSAFEDWTPSQEKFDLVVSFTAFHWLNPKTRYQKIHAVLSSSGYLAIVKYHHVAGGDTSFFYNVQECYKKYKPSESEFRLPKAGSFISISPEVYASGLFKEPITRNYLTEVTYSRADYEKLLMTYSDHRILEEPRRSQLLNCIGSLIDNHYAGQIRKCYLHELILAGRR